MTETTSMHVLDLGTFTVVRNPDNQEQAATLTVEDGRDPGFRLDPFTDLQGACYAVGACLKASPQLKNALASFSPPDTPYGAALLTAAETALYLAMQLESRPQPTWHQWRQAARRNIELPEADAVLTPWVANAAVRYLQPPLPEARPVSEHAVLCPAYEFPPPTACTLTRAFELAPDGHALYFPNDRAGNYAWYRRLPVVADVDADPRLMTVTVRLKDHDDNDLQPLVLPTDTVLQPKPFRPGDDGPVHCVGDHGMAADDLAALLARAYFDYDPEDGGDWENQHARFGDRALHSASTLLENDDQATLRVLERIADREMAPYLPDGMVLRFGPAPGGVCAQTIPDTRKNPQ